MGTYQINPGFFVSSVSSWEHLTSPPGTQVPMTPSLAVDALASIDDKYVRRDPTADPAPAGNFYMRSAANFLIDGVPTGRQSYPAGFWIHDVTCHYYFAVTDAPTNLMLGSIVLLPQITSGGSPKTASHTVNNADLNFIHRVLNDPFGWNFLGHVGGGQIFEVNHIYLTGTWDYWSTQFTITAEDIGPGREVIINDGANTLGKFGKFFVSYIDPTSNQFVTTEASIVPGSLLINGSQIRIIIPDDIPGNIGSITISGELNGLGNNFGEVIMGVVLLANASGIYTLIPDRTKDTLYDRATPGATYDTAIPTPMAKIGGVP